MPFHDFVAVQFLKAQALQLREPQNVEQVPFLEVMRYNRINTGVQVLLKSLCKEEYIILGPFYLKEVINDKTGQQTNRGSLPIMFCSVRVNVC